VQIEFHTVYDVRRLLRPNIARALLVLLAVQVSLHFLASPALFGDGPVNTGKSSARGVTALVSVARKKHLGDRLPLSVVITNEGSGPVVIGETKTFVDCVVSVRNVKSNTPLAYTVHGRNVIGETQDGMRAGSYRRNKLDKGGSLQRTMDMTGCFDVSPGEYVLSLTLLVNPFDKTKAFRIKVDDIPFELTSRGR
jgi:hypothetical protein